MKRRRENRSNACKQGEQVGRVDKKCGISGGGKKAGKCKNICTPGRSPSLLPSPSPLPSWPSPPCLPCLYRPPCLSSPPIYQEKKFDVKSLFEHTH